MLSKNQLELVERIEMAFISNGLTPRPIVTMDDDGGACAAGSLIKDCGGWTEYRDFITAAAPGRDWSWVSTGLMGGFDDGMAMRSTPVNERPCYLFGYWIGQEVARRVKSKAPYERVVSIPVPMSS